MGGSIDSVLSMRARRMMNCKGMYDCDCIAKEITEYAMFITGSLAHFEVRH
jgi:hypothetical protein